MRGCATLMRASEVTYKAVEWGSERPSGFDVGF